MYLEHITISGLINVVNFLDITYWIEIKITSFFTNFFTSRTITLLRYMNY